jgi:hypothetical protein
LVLYENASADWIVVVYAGRVVERFAPQIDLLFLCVMRNFTLVEVLELLVLAIKFTEDFHDFAFDLKLSLFGH